VKGKIENILFREAIISCGAVGKYFSNDRWGDQFTMYMEEEFVKIERLKGGNPLYVHVSNVLQVELAVAEPPKKVKSPIKKVKSGTKKDNSQKATPIKKCA
jgi:hypothetical protein